MHEYPIEVKNKIAMRNTSQGIICGNTDYVFVVDFDSEWSDHDTKTLRMVFENGEYIEVEFTGDSVNVPLIEKHKSMEVGFIAGNLKTTTGAYIPLIPSITEKGDKEEKTIQALDVTENGVYEATGSIAGYSPVNVDVPQPQGEISITENGTHDVTDYETASVDVPADVEPLTVTQNGTYTSEHDGYQPVVVNVPQPTGTKQITENGTHNVYDYAEAEVNVEPVLQDKTITENGTYTADEGYDGLGEVTVDVENVLKYATSIGFSPQSDSPLTLPETLIVEGVNLSSLSNAFADATSTHIVVKSQAEIKNMGTAFVRCSALEILDLSGVDTSACTNMSNAFRYCRVLREIRGIIDCSGITAGNLYAAFLDINNLVEVRLKENTVMAQNNIVFAHSPLLSDDSIVSIANAPNESGAATIQLPNTPKARLNAIYGTSSLDETETYHIFTPDENGDMTLAEFITEVKGWTIA